MFAPDRLSNKLRKVVSDKSFQIALLLYNSNTLLFINFVDRIVQSHLIKDSERSVNFMILRHDFITDRIIAILNTGT